MNSEKAPAAASPPGFAAAEPLPSALAFAPDADADADGAEPDGAYHAPFASERVRAFTCAAMLSALGCAVLYPDAGAAAA